MDEAGLVEERENNRIVTEAILIQQAISSVLSAKARSGFTKSVRNLNVRSKVRRLPHLTGLTEPRESERPERGTHGPERR